MLLALVQLALVIRTRVLVTHVAREAVREAAVGGSRADIVDAAVAAADLNPDRLVVEVTVRGERVEVVVRYRGVTEVPVVGPLLDDVDFEASAVMRRER